MAAAGQDVAEKIALLGGDSTHVSVVNQLGEAEDGIERGAQLVRHVGEELRLVSAGPGELLGLLLQPPPRVQERRVLLLERAPLRLHLARLLLRLREQRAQLGPAPRHIEGDGKGLAHGSEQFSGALLPGPQGGQLQDAGDRADADERNQSDRAG